MHKAFCSSTKETEDAFRAYKPDFVWLDCYLGEISEIGQGVKNSGLLLAGWMKKHNPDIKIMLFTSSNEQHIFQAAKEINVEGLAAGGKFIKDKEIIIEGVKDILAGKEWRSPNFIDDFELRTLGKVTIFEFCIICSMIIGKNTAQIADELDTTRKRINNSIYRVKEKLKIPDDTRREELLEILKDKIRESFNPNEHYQISDIISLNSIVQEYLEPVMQEVKDGKLERADIKSYYH